MTTAMPESFFLIADGLSRLRKFDRLSDGSWNMSQSTVHVGGEFEFIDRIDDGAARLWFEDPNHMILVPLNRQ